MTPQATTSHLDPERGLGTLGSDVALRKILASVETSLAASMLEMRQALAAGDLALVTRLLHAIKGYVPIFCSDALVEQLKHVEAQSKTETAATLTPLLAELWRQLENLLLEIRRYLA